MLSISNTTSIKEDEIQFIAIRAQGAGGQHVNKVSTAIHLRFDSQKSNLPAYVKDALLGFNDQRINKQGIIIIKAQNHRSQEKNKEEALSRLKDLIQKATVRPKKRKASQPSKSAKRKRLDKKNQRGQTKTLRGKVSY